MLDTPPVKRYLTRLLHWVTVRRSNAKRDSAADRSGVPQDSVRNL